MAVDFTTIAEMVSLGGRIFPTSGYSFSSEAYESASNNIDHLRDLHDAGQSDFAFRCCPRRDAFLALRYKCLDDLAYLHTLLGLSRRA